MNYFYGITKSPEKMEWLCNHLDWVLSKKDDGNEIIDEFIDGIPYFMSYSKEELEKAQFFTDTELVFYRNEAICRVAFENLTRRLKHTRHHVYMEYADPEAIEDEEGEPYYSDTTAGCWYLWFD